MICPQCNDYLSWFCDNTCDEVYGCDCEFGLIGHYICNNEECSISLVVVTDSCEGCIYGK